ncbi:MAG TPA: dienelactone hydrolase family protein [Candidatus Cybelea sp.]|jgi:dienelactone hydrolase
MLQGFTKSTFADDNGNVRTYFRIGSGPAVMVIHEFLGLSPSTLDFCRRLSDEGFTVYAPVLFGRPGTVPSAFDLLKSAAQICISREFALFAHSRSSPVADSLRALARRIVANHQPSRYGVIGLCLTGNFALAMMGDSALVAPVAGEPALPLGVSRDGRASLGLSAREIAVVKERLAEGVTVLGYRFKPDTVCPKERFEAMREIFGSGFEGHCIDPSPKRARHHSVFTQDYDPDWAPTRDAFLRLVAFLRDRL